MNAFLIPPKHFFPIARLLLLFAFGALCMREGYDDGRTWGTPEREHQPIAGRYRWLVVGLLATELVVIYKYREGTGNLLNDPTPWYIWVPWSLSILSLFAFWIYLRFKPDHTVKYPGIDQA